MTQTKGSGRNQISGRRSRDEREFNVQIIELAESDLESGFLEALDNLIPGTSTLPHSRAIQILKEIKSNPLHKIFVAKTDSKVAGTTTLLVEPKFIFKGGRVGHIENVSVRTGFEKMGIGGSLVLHATTVARRMGCVKVVLDCSNETMRFYEKLGYSYQDNCMRRTLS